MNAPTHPNGRHVAGPVDFPDELAAELEPQPAPADWTTSEAPASVNVKVNYRGYDVLVTLRGPSGRDVLTRLDGALTWIETRGGTSTLPPMGCAPLATVDVQGGNGHDGPPVCPTHGRAMKRNRRDDGWFCSAKVAEDDGTGRVAYCKHTCKDVPA